MLTTLEKFGIVAIAVLGLQFTRWFTHLMYYQFLGPLYLHPKPDVKKMGKWAGEFLKSDRFETFPVTLIRMAVVVPTLKVTLEQKMHDHVIRFVFATCFRKNRRVILSMKNAYLVFKLGRFQIAPR